MFLHRMVKSVMFAGMVGGLVGCSSNAGTGALIGGATGAGVGAIIGHNSHNHTAGGAVIGGAVGAIGGALVGGELDREQAQRRVERDSYYAERDYYARARPIQRDVIVDDPYYGRVVERELIDPYDGHVIDRYRVVEEEPLPPARVEVIPVHPYYGAVWVRGYWVRERHHWVWVPGHWR